LTGFDRLLQEGLLHKKVNVHAATSANFCMFHIYNAAAAADAEAHAFRVLIPVFQQCWHPVCFMQRLQVGYAVELLVSPRQ